MIFAIFIIFKYNFLLVSISRFKVITMTFMNLFLNKFLQEKENGWKKELVGNSSVDFFRKVATNAI